MREKDPIAVELGRRGGLKGGRALTEKRTQQERSEAARHAANARWGNKPPLTHARLAAPRFASDPDQYVCRVCAQLAPLKKNGVIAGQMRDHYPLYDKDAYDQRAGNYCRGSGMYPEASS